MSHLALSRRAVLRWGAASLSLGPLGALPAWAQRASPVAAGIGLHLSNRLGYGPVPGELARLDRLGLAGYLAEQLEPQRLPLPASLTSALGQLSTLAWGQGELIERYRRAAKAGRQEKSAMAAGERKGESAKHELTHQVGFEAAQARILRALHSPRQLEEVLVEFWFNHFNVFIGKGLCRVLVGHYEQHAIRPHVLGRFRDLLGATAKHPAMLFYLDNWMSVAGCSAPAADNPKRPSGLNENYARELMELHTLGVDGGYSQRDVTELARIFTGWGIHMRPTGDSAFQFAADRHDNGEKQWLGQRVQPSGQAEGERALDLLARHPATARHLSRKLAQYFVADEPTQALVDRLAQRYVQSDGDLKVVLRTLFDSPEFSAPAAQQSKFKPPYRYLLSALRASEAREVEVKPLVAVLQRLGMPLYGSPTPDGYKYTEQAWLNPDAMQSRVTFATAFASGRLPELQDDAGGMGGEMDPKTARKAAKAEKQASKGADKGAKGDKPLADMEDKAARISNSRSWGPVNADNLLQTLGPAISTRTREVVAQTDAALRAAVVLGSPDFMRH